MNNLWSFNVNGQQWKTLPSPDSQQLIPRGGCAFVYLNNALWVYGGFCGRELDDIAQFDLITQNWTYFIGKKGTITVEIFF